ncbi:MAG: glycosyltransferase, partial [Opitutaceae bacterium]
MCAIHSRDSVFLAEKALRSVLSQDYPREQINIYLYVDGPVTRAHECFLDTHSEWFHRVVRDDINRGLPTGLNALLGSTSGEQFFFRMDVDDIVSRDRFRRQVDVSIYNKGALETAFESRAPTFLDVTMIEHFAAEGRRWYDMGESGGSESARAYKLIPIRSQVETNSWRDRLCPVRQRTRTTRRSSLHAGARAYLSD